VLQCFALSPPISTIIVLLIFMQSWLWLAYAFHTEQFIEYIKGVVESSLVLVDDPTKRLAINGLICAGATTAFFVFISDLALAPLRQFCETGLHDLPEITYSVDKPSPKTTNVILISATAVLCVWALVVPISFGLAMWQIYIEMGFPKSIIFIYSYYAVALTIVAVISVAYNQHHKFDEFRYLGLVCMTLGLLANSYGVVFDREAPLAFAKWVGAPGLLLVYAVGVYSLLYGLSNRHVAVVTRVIALALFLLILVRPIQLGLPLIFKQLDDMRIAVNGAKAPDESKSSQPATSVVRNPAVPALTEYFSRWSEARRPLREHFTQAGKRVPLFIVAAEGGGLYAAYAAAFTLAALADRCPSFGAHVFAISSVSGGALGSSLFSSITERHINSSTIQAQIADCHRIASGAQQPSSDYVNFVRRFFANDFLTPILSTALYHDFQWAGLLSSEKATRGETLATSFEAAWVDAAGGGSNPFAEPFGAAWERSTWTPLVLLNTTMVNDGSPVVIAPIDLSHRTGHVGSAYPRQYFDLPAAKIPLKYSDAIVASASFPYVTPTLRVGVDASHPSVTGSVEIKLTDGGYFDNTGLFVANELIRNLIADSAGGNLLKDYEIFVIRLSVNAIGKDEPLAPSMSDALAPIQTMYSVRSVFQSLIGAPQQGLYQQVITIAVPSGRLKLPLSWQLSAGSRGAIEKHILESGGRELDVDNASAAPIDMVLKKLL
jgi:hypothetical protein